MEKQVFLEMLLNDALQRTIDGEKDVLSITNVHRYPINTSTLPIDVHSKYTLIGANENFYQILSKTYNSPDVYCEEKND